MQKKVCGIWWNVKAAEMIHGWENVNVKITLAKPVDEIKFYDKDFNNPTITTQLKFPYTAGESTFIRIPTGDYNAKSKDLNQAFVEASTQAFSQASAWAQNKIGAPEKTSLISADQKTINLIYGPWQEDFTNKRSVESKFYTKWFPTSITIQLSVGENVKFKGIRLDKIEEAEIYSGVVFGAIKYKDKWLAARITKMPE